MKKSLKNSERTILISSKRIEIFNPENGQWEEVTDVPYIPLIVNRNITEANGIVTNEISFIFPYTDEPVPSYETETYVMDSEKRLTYIRRENEEYNDPKYKIRYNNSGIKTLEERSHGDNKHTLECVHKVRAKVLTLIRSL